MNRDGKTKVDFVVNEITKLFSDMYVKGIYEISVIVELISQREKRLFNLVASEYMYNLVEDTYLSEGITELIYINDEF